MNLRNNQWKRAYNKLAEEFFDLQQELEDVSKDKETILETLDFYKDELYKFPTRFTWMGVEYIKTPPNDPWTGCACGNSSTCGNTFTTEKVDKVNEVNYIVDPEGVVDKPNLTEGRYTVLVKRED